MSEKQALLQALPKVDRLLEDPRIIPLIDKHSRTLVVDKIRIYLENLRQSVLNGNPSSEALEYDRIAENLVEWAEIALDRGLKRAVNGVGIVLHTALGRAPLAPAAQDKLMDSVAHYCTLQIDRDTGNRGDRYATVEELLRNLTGAEAALIVNNNAAATLLILNTLAGGREAIVSRGELVEIGGAFRIPDVMRRSGAHLVEVGTTNRTHLKDYQNAITEETALILRVHQSNYRIIGFTKLVPLEELVELAHAQGILFVDDLGSGALVDLSRWGLPKEPMVQDSVKAGADVICFSGDKLLGGPQCGVILGKKNVIDRIKKNQLTRALRCDKMTFAVMEATLRLFLDEETILEKHPVLRMLSEPSAEIKKRCQSLKRKLNPLIEGRGFLEIVEETSEAGSGSLAAEHLPTWALSVQVLGLSAEQLSKKLRFSDPPVFSRIKEDVLLLDCRTILREEFKWIYDAFIQILGPPLDNEDIEEIKVAGEETAEKIADDVKEITNGDSS